MGLKRMKKYVISLKLIFTYEFTVYDTKKVFVMKDDEKYLSSFPDVIYY